MDVSGQALDLVTSGDEESGVSERRAGGRTKLRPCIQIGGQFARRDGDDAAPRCNGRQHKNSHHGRYTATVARLE